MQSSKRMAATPGRGPHTAASKRAVWRPAPQPAAAAARAAAAAAAAVPPEPTLVPAPAQRLANGYPVSALNAATPSAALGEVPPLLLPPLAPIATPLLLAPMAGITSAPLRTACYAAGASICVSEMILAHELISGSAKTRHLASFHESEPLRSAQLYAVDPDAARAAARVLVRDFGAQHIDLNFGCPVRKVTARGGGAALPLRPRLFARLVAAAVEGAGGAAAVTVKLRIGLARDPAEMTYFLEAGRIAEREGAAGVTLHARTADQLYSPPADWGAVRALAAALAIPVIGNGDVFEGLDAIRMIRETGCAGVMIGRGCLGRPWLFTEAAAALSGDPALWPPPPPPALGGVLEAALSHVTDLAAWEGSERAALLEVRKLIGCYLAGFERPDLKDLKRRLYAAEGLRDWEAAVRDYRDDPEPWPAAALRLPRLKGGGADGRPARQRVALPPGWLEGRDEEGVPDGLTGDACEG